MNTYINKIIDSALAEDSSSQDITTGLLIPKDHKCTAYLVAKERGVLCGVTIAQQIYKRIDPRINFTILHQDGAKISPRIRIARITGNTRAILKGERTAINFVMHLSGISTLTHAFIKKADNRKVKILDTRKTIPGLRYLEKYAVLCGGGMNHRMNLNDMVLIKDNHLATLKDIKPITDIIRDVRQRTKKTIEIEVTSMKEFKHACKAGPDIILLDNMKPSCIKSAVVYLKQHHLSQKIALEASGGINLKNIRTFAQTGVNRISIGALTHSAPAINMSIEF